ncbi:hypothetical protein DACRYDRAFT_95169 [Dacryopinax primogenitus]|uniref:Alcohol dehydrogenase-like C-terminal domain-containing protein n=1 Tax=Dacryopinax primogenitus (strain DJM 731) TaxID=1858805 RepID=M5G0K0_DACPD|nr:uncharacterized protein DACRYDRAFT_95169 [Dacryopinax primogenitus]EJU01655.1 hypothetical protein DACRYDRAFT_95169 [Dacryopinax primogenitus]
MRTRMVHGGWKLGEPPIASGVAEVVRSEHPVFPEQAKLFGLFHFQKYEYFDSSYSHWGDFRILHNEQGIPWTAYLSAAGLNGKTAFYGLKALAHPQPREKIFVTTGAGSVGLVVCQPCTSWGLSVLASTDTDEKAEYLRSLGISAFNYRTASTSHELEKFGGVDIY